MRKFKYAFGGDEDDVLQLKDTKNLKTGKYSKKVITDWVRAAKAANVDPYEMLALGWQEGNLMEAGQGQKKQLSDGTIRRSRGSVGQVKDFSESQLKVLTDLSAKYPDIPQQYLKSAIAFGDKLKYADSLGLNKTESMRLQAYNGYGTIYPNKKDGKFVETKMYGQIVPETGINFKKTPLYGDRLVALKKDLMANKDIQGIIKQYAAGGEVGATSGFNWGGLAQQIPVIADGIIDLIENDPNRLSTQPTINAATMKTMVSPYNHFAMGGEMDEETMAQLEAMAEENGITVEELIAQMQGKEEEPDELGLLSEMIGDEEFAYGGVKINKGMIKAMKKYADGGTVEVEGGEVLQLPNGKLSKVKGPKHESGGVDMNLPNGTKIYSDRLSIDGSTMQERKLRREKTIARMTKFLEGNPSDKITKSSLERTIQTTEMEEASDMQLQKIMNAAYNSKNKKKAAYGDVIGDEVPTLNGAAPANPYLWNLLGDAPTNPYNPNYIQDTPVGTIDDIDTPTLRTRSTPATNTKVYNEAIGDSVEDENGLNLTLGDKIGLAGNIFNGIAPILNTINNRKGDRPNINRFEGFGREAIQSNDNAQAIAAETKANSVRDLSTAVNSRRIRNRNSASSVNTIRALDIATDMEEDKATGAINDSFANKMIGLMSQRGQLTNQRDSVVMRGRQMRDAEDKADRDNYDSNMAANLVNLGTNVQGIGRALNVAESNKVNTKLLSQMSQFGLTFDEEGNLINQ